MAVAIEIVTASFHIGPKGDLTFPRRSSGQISGSRMVKVKKLEQRNGGQ